MEILQLDQPDAGYDRSVDSKYVSVPREEELLDQGIKPNTIRLSIGTEHIDDIIQDLDEAFKAVE